MAELWREKAPSVFVTPNQGKSPTLHTAHHTHKPKPLEETNTMGKKKGGKKQDAAENDDWDILNEAAAAVETSEPKVEKEETATADADDNTGEDVGATDAAAAFLAAQGLSVGGEAAARDKKKKKKKKGPADKAEKPADEKVSAKGKLIAERLRLQREEEEKRLAAEEAERLRIAESKHLCIRCDHSFYMQLVSHFFSHTTSHFS